MQHNDYYLVLGIRHDEGPSGVRAAFRELARRYHPDRAGPNGARFFRDLVEAYAVLSDDERRASYDRGLAHADPDDEPTRRPIAPRPAWAEPESLVPDRISLLRDFQVTQPSVEEVFQRFLRDFVLAPPHRGGAPEPLRLQVIVDREQALRGGLLELDVPVFFPCAHCQASGSNGPFSCDACEGVGLVEREESVWVHVPAGVRDGTVLELPLRGLGIHATYLEVVVRVG
jgi:molecular chaperone DnaJ